MRTSEDRLAFARALRRRPTRAERVLWHALRAGQLHGLKFRRQVPIGPFIADFFCPSARLIVEVDGITHAGGVADARRDSWMRREGFRVLRVFDDDVIGNLQGVLGVIYMAACEPLPPAPSPKGRGSRPVWRGRSSPPPLGGGGRGEGAGGKRQQ